MALSLFNPLLYLNVLPADEVKTSIGKYGDIVDFEVGNTATGGYAQCPKSFRRNVNAFFTYPPLGALIQSIRQSS